MKKSILFIAALALTFAACQKEGEVENKTVATFEEAAISPALNSYFAYGVDTTVMLQSGMYQVQQTVAYGGSYVTGAVVTNITNTEFKDYTDAYKSAAGGAYAGKNYVVWYEDGFTPNAVKLNAAAVVPGMYVCNNVYALSSMKDGDAIAGEPFGEGDYFTLIITGSLEGKDVNAKVEFDLGRGTNFVTEWTYVDLSKLGKIDELHFAFEGSRTGDWGLNTPTYFCFDNIGAKKK
jgi:hypothetical protein